MRIDPVLEKELAEASSTSREVGVWGTLGVPSGQNFMSSAQVEELARRIVARAEEASGAHAGSVQIYQNLNTFSLDGSVDLIRNLAEQPEIASLKAVHKNQSFAFDPIPTTPDESAKTRPYRRSRSQR